MFILRRSATLNESPSILALSFKILEIGNVLDTQLHQCRDMRGKMGTLKSPCPVDRFT